MRLTQQPFTSYGLASSTGLNRNEVEGIRAGASNGTSADLYYTDYGSFAEIAVKAVGNTASMSAPGVLGQFVSKSGGNIYHGNVYADYQSEAMEAQQHQRRADRARPAGRARVRRAGPEPDGVLPRLQRRPRRLHQEGQAVVVRRVSIHADQPAIPNLIDEAQKSWNPVYTTKWTYNVKQRQKLIGYYQYTNKRQPDYLFGSTTILKSDALPIRTSRCA